MTLKTGLYKTRSGLPAIVKKLVSEKKSWILKGVVEGPKTGAYWLVQWDMDGKCLNTDSHLFDLIPESWESGSN